jgi:hypothetical protein
VEERFCQLERDLGRAEHGIALEPRVDPVREAHARLRVGLAGRRVHQRPREHPRDLGRP